MSRKICVDLHQEIIRLRPKWYHKDDDKGFIKVIMTGSASDPTTWQEHIRNKQRRRNIGERMKDPSDPLNIVIVRDMWLTGFDVKNLHTMYVDKPMRGHGLMQARNPAKCLGIPSPCSQVCLGADLVYPYLSHT